MDNLTLELIDKDGLDPEIQEALAKIEEALAVIMQTLADILREIGQKLMPMVLAWEEIAVKPCVPGKLWHLYKHGKSHRVRKKNSKRVYSAFWEGEK